MNLKHSQMLGAHHFLLSPSYITCHYLTLLFQSLSYFALFCLLFPYFTSNNFYWFNLPYFYITVLCRTLYHSTPTCITSICIMLPNQTHYDLTLPYLTLFCCSSFALCFPVLLCVTLCYPLSLCVTVCYPVLLCITLCYPVLLCVTVCYPVLLCVTVC